MKKLSSGLLNALFVPMPVAVQFSLKPWIVPLSGDSEGIPAVKNQKECY
ncbi:MAG: hypothetical protein JJD98_08455 [Polaromonas sp.]|nr:hypothetical protein [Polaromonas sp.]